MDSHIRAEAQAVRATHYFDIMRTVCFVETGILAIIVFGDPAGHLLGYWALIIGTAIYAVVAGDQALRDVQALRDSMDEATARSHYGKAALKINFGMLRGLSAVANAAVALALLASI